MNTRRFDIYAPLQNFYWPGQDFELSPGLTIRRFAQTPDLAGLHAQVSKDEWESATNAHHWLTFQWIDGVVPSPAEVVNLVLLSLWLAKPVRSQIALRFQIGREAAAGEQSRQRLLDRFAWVPGTIDPSIEDSDLNSASLFYTAFETLRRAHGRLNNAMVLTVAGCWSHGWQTALICHAAAAETILTYATGRDLTRRLATSYACLVESDAMRRDAAFTEFRTLYSARSDIMHGRMYNIAKDDRLPILVRFQNVLRKLWQTVLSSRKVISILESSDAAREAYFQAVQSGYAAPT